MIACSWLPGWIRWVICNFDAHQGFWMVSCTIALVLIGLLTCVYARKSDKARSRPYVILETIPGIFLGVKLSNIGLTAAKNVRVESNPVIRTEFARLCKEIGFLSKGVSYLPPRASFKTSIGTLSALRKANETMIYRGRISYESENGDKYTEDFVLDYSLYEDVTSEPESPIAKRIDELRRILELIANGFYKPHVLVEGYDAYNRKIAKFIAEQQSEQGLGPKDDSAVNSDEEGV